MHFVNFAAELVYTRHTFPGKLSTFIRSRFQAKPATLLIPIDFSILLFRGQGTLRYSVPKWLLFHINLGSGFHCLRSLFLFSCVCRPLPPNHLIPTKKPLLFCSPDETLCVSASIGWCRTRNNILSCSMPVVFTLSAFFSFFNSALYGDWAVSSPSGLFASSPDWHLQSN